jgi:uncharacterized protein (TIGR03083 family)
MTKQGLAALPELARTAIELGESLSETDWAQPSACPGWSVHDIFVHLACTLRESVDPESMPPTVPGKIERSNDRAVAAFRSLTPRQTLDLYRDLIEPALVIHDNAQTGDAASREVDLEDAGTYPAHLMVDSLVFDHYCHLRHDLGGFGPLDFSVRADAVVMESSLSWLIAGLPQMSAARLPSVLTAPFSLELTGPGGGTWTLAPVPTTIEVKAATREADAAISSTAEDFLVWGTHRGDWREYVRLGGDASLAAQVVDAIKVF